MCTALALWLTAIPVGLSGADDAAALDLAAVRELLEGDGGSRVAWSQAPRLVILGRVMEFTGANMANGYAATRDEIQLEDAGEMIAEFTQALQQLTGGTVMAFSDVRIERLEAGETVHVFQPGSIVVGRYRGVHSRAGTLGFGGRMTRRGAIAAASVVLDSDFDRKNARRKLLRTHELGHALGFNHVESRPSVMNPVVGHDVTDFDRSAIRFAFGEPPAAPRPQLPDLSRVLYLLN